MSPPNHPPTLWAAILAADPFGRDSSRRDGALVDGLRTLLGAHLDESIEDLRPDSLRSLQWPDEWSRRRREFVQGAIRRGLDRIGANGELLAALDSNSTDGWPSLRPRDVEAILARVPGPLLPAARLVADGVEPTELATILVGDLDSPGQIHIDDTWVQLSQETVGALAVSLQPRAENKRDDPLLVGRRTTGGRPEPFSLPALRLAVRDAAARASVETQGGDALDLLWDSRLDRDLQ